MDEFRISAIDWVRQQATLLRNPQDYGFVSVAAHLFALASEIRPDPGDLFGRVPEPVRSLQELSFRFKSLSDSLDLVDLYFHLIEGVLTVESVLQPRRDAKALERPTELMTHLPGANYPLGGRVYHWLRPHSALAEERKRRYQAADSRRPPAPFPHPSEHLGRLALFWEKTPIPRLVPPPSRLDRRIPLVEESGPDASRRGSFRIALCPLLQDIHATFEVTPDRRHFQARHPEGINRPDELVQHLTALIEAAGAQGVHLLVLPELTVSPQAREHLATTLRARHSRLPYGVIAGSFHFQDEEASDPAPPQGRRPYNEALLLDHSGKPLLRHRKQKGFRVPRDLVAPPFFPGGIPDSCGPEVQEFYEGIEEDSRLAVLDTSLGRIALLICFDTIAADPHKSVVEIVEKIRPDLLFILSMSSETQPFETFFEIANRDWIGVFFVNARCVCGKKKNPLLAFCDPSLYELEGASPTRFRWRTVEDRPQCRPHRSPSAEKVEDRGEGPGTPRRWLECEPAWKVEKHPLLGLVVDLGVHWQAFQEDQEPETASEEKMTP